MLATNDSGLTSLAVSWDESPTPGGRNMLGVMLRNTNIGLFDLEGHDGTSWVALATINNTIGPLEYTRTGSAIFPGVGGLNPYLRHGEFVGGTFAFSASDPSTTDPQRSKRIVSHPEGVWESSASLKSTLRLTSVVSTDPLSGSSGLIIPRDVLVMQEVSQAFSAIRIVVPNTTTGSHPAEEYFEIGSLSVGWAYPMGTDSAWGRSLQTNVNLESIETRDGQRKVKRVAPDQRSMNISWTTGIDQTGMEDDFADPDHVSLNAEGGASHRGTAYALDGLFRDLGGSANTMIYVPRIQTPLSGTLVLNRRRDAMHGRITNGAIDRQTILGDENLDEVVRVATLTIVEEN